MLPWMRRPRRCATLALVATIGAWDLTAQEIDHPLDPLSKDEILKTAEVLRAAGKANEKSRFSLIALREPPKREVLTYRGGREFRRESFAIVYEREQNRTFEAVVDLRAGSVVSWRHVP